MSRTLREAAQMALDALLTGYHQGTQDAIAALREALAADHLRDVAEKVAPAAPVPDGMVPEWAAFLEYWTHESHLQTFADRERFRAAARAMIAASPAAPAAPVVPLTDEQLAKIAVEDEFLLYCDQDSFNEIARAIELAHGIGTTGGGK